jgi:Zn-dependent protease with chaperone function
VPDAANFGLSSTRAPPVARRKRGGSVITAVRAALSAALLLGFYLYALSVVALLALLTAWLSTVANGVVVGKLAWITIAAAAAVVVATWRVIRARPEPLAGLVLGEARTPELWSEVRAIARAVGTRPPDEIRLVADVNAAVAEHTRLLGLIAGRRYLYIGLPLLHGLTAGQVRSVLAHELGHYSRRHTRLAALTYRGMTTMEETIVRVGPHSLAGWLLRGYAMVYALVAASVQRRQEVEADRASARIVGPATAASALRELPALAAAWGFYLENYVGWGLDSGTAPRDVLGNFPHLLVARSAKLARIRTDGMPDRRSRFDSHPPIAERVALLERQPDHGVPVDDRPGWSLLPDPVGAAAALEAEVIDFGGRTRVPFPDYTVAGMQYAAHRAADVLYRAAGRLFGATSTLGGVLDLLDAGRAEELSRGLIGGGSAGTDQARARLAYHLESAMCAAVVDAGAATWRHSWSEPADLVGRGGAPIDLSQVAGPAAAGDTVPARRRLAELGVDLVGSGVRETTATAAGSDALAGLMNVVVAGKRSDVILLDSEIVFVPGLPRLKIRRAKQRVHAMLTQVPAASLAATSGHRYLPYEEIASADLTRRVPKTYTLRLHDGESIPIRWGGEAEEMGPGWEVLRRAVGVVGKRA